MFNQGLSLDQAPPISVVLRFFLTVPLFGLLLSLIMILYPHEVLTPTHPVSLGAIHLLFLGVISMSMIGALFQMQSVLGGTPIPSPVGNSLIVHTLFAAGVLALCGAFFFSQPAGFVIAAVLLGSAIVFFAQLLLNLLFKAVSHDTLRGMRLAVISLLVTALLGVVMATAYANETFGNYHDVLRESHYSLGLIGWVGALIVAVAFQVVEMFYVTTSYSSWCKRNAFRIITASLFLKIVFLFARLPFVWVFDLVLAALMLGFAVTTVRRLRERKRRVSDVSIWFWGTGMGLLLISLMAHLAYLYWALESLETTALISFALFALSIILGMMSKIVPFLIWFHLSAQGFMETPIMSNIIPARRNQLLFALFGISALFALVSPAYSSLLSFSGGGFLALFGLLGYNLTRAANLYAHTKATGTRFEMSMHNAAAS
ncbi:MAG TPA: hypothetical protein VFX57_03090 [Sulfuricurvum sp.]|nr:hypothetical protein [Sulfuricurvum sp.]